MEVTEAACSGSSLHFPQLHCQAAPLNRRAKNLLIPSVVLGLGAFSVLLRGCSFQISRFRWAKLGLFHLNMLPGSGHGLQKLFTGLLSSSPEWKLWCRGRGRV